MDCRTLVVVSGGYSEHSGSDWLVLSDLHLVLALLKPRRLIVHVNDLHRQHLGGGVLRCPMILSDDSEIVAVLLLSVHSFEDGERA